MGLATFVQTVVSFGVGGLVIFLLGYMMYAFIMKARENMKRILPQGNKKTTETKGSYCSSCGQEAKGDYCPSCGKEITKQEKSK